jgi:hypothetical protein
MDCINFLTRANGYLSYCSCFCVHTVTYCYILGMNKVCENRTNEAMILGSMGGVAARRSPLATVTSGSTPGLGVICELSLLLILSLALMVFLRVLLASQQ